MNTTELKGKTEIAKAKPKRKFTMIANGDHHYIDDWNQNSIANLKSLTKCELYKLNIKFCNTSWF